LARVWKGGETVDVQIGDKIAGRYRLLRRLASGGMGEVWAASNELTNRDFAIKFLLKEFASNDEAYNRFVREAETTGKLQHSSIVDVFDVAQTVDGRPFIVMELLVGEGLDERLKREGTLTPIQVAAYFSQIAMALDLAHRAGVVHRDLSSSNIFLARSRDHNGTSPKILDFGVSKHLGPNDGEFQTCHGAVLGNPLYMSPEQARGAEQVDARTDIWSLGVLMYQCLTGVAAFSSRNYNALMVDIMTRPHRPITELAPAVDRSLVAIVEGCLVKDRTRRIGSASELAERLAVVARRLGREEDVAPDSPRRRATDRLPPVRGVVGALDRPSNAQLRGVFRLVPRGMSYGRVASLAGLLGVVLGAVLVYCVVAMRGGAVATNPLDGNGEPGTTAAEEPAVAPSAEKGQTRVPDAASPQTVARRSRLER
jgi:serine/threonine protein kinase